jgi:energy-coupling factor transporter ATP-binding protein EcfA2
MFKENNDLKIGKIIEVNGNSIKVELDNNLGNLSKIIDGRVYSVGQMSSIIKIHFGRKIIFGYVKMLRMSSEIDFQVEKPIMQPDDSRILEADLFGEAFWSESQKKLTFNRGVETYPLPLQFVYLTIKEELEKVYEAAEKNAESSHDPMITIGTYIGSNSAICKANMDKLFGNHCAILGSTGSGKSATVAAILHSVLEYRYDDNKQLYPRIILIDPHGEYGRAFKNDALLFRAYSESSVGGDSTKELKLPYWLMSGDELRSMIIGKTEYEATSQNNMIYEALTYARMVQADIVQSLGDDPDGDQIPNLVTGRTENDRENFDRDKPIPFNLDEFVKHIDKVQGRKIGSKLQRTASDDTRQKVEAILKKIRVLRSNPQLNFIMSNDTENPATIDKILAQLVGKIQDSENKSLRIIDISGLPNEVSGPLTALICRLLFQYKLWQTTDERRKDPILIACEEAHRYVPNQGEAQYKEAQEAIRRIAKEGRKYGIGLMLISQRPSDVESTVLSQCNSWIVLRLTNSADQEYVSRFLPDSLTGLTKILSSLTRREAIFVGEAAALPSRIRIKELSKEQLPDSADMSFVDGWTNDFLEDISLKQITDRWVGCSIANDT